MWQCSNVIWGSLGYKNNEIQAHLLTEECSLQKAFQFFYEGFIKKIPVARNDNCTDFDASYIKLLSFFQIVQVMLVELLVVAQLVQL